jgi:hypothetical protein
MNIFGNNDDKEEDKEEDNDEQALKMKGTNPLAEEESQIEDDTGSD